VLKQLSLEGNKMESLNANSSVKHLVPMLKKDDLNKYMAWSDAIKGLILATDCLLRTLKNHDDLLSMDPTDTNQVEILSIMAKNEKVMDTSIWD
jgi:hypothetical protein